MPALSGTLSMAGQPLTLRGKLSVQPPYTPYEEDIYEVTPTTHTQTLNTANKVLKKDIVVTAIPYFETENPSKGITAYIAKED